MTTVLDTKLIPKVLAIVAKYGKTVTFVELTTQTYDPATGQTTEAESDHSHKVTPPAAVAERFIDGDLLRVGDTEVYLPASGLGFTPVVGMRVEIASASDTWRIVRCDAIYTGDDIALYRVVLRQ